MAAAEALHFIEAIKPIVVKLTPESRSRFSEQIVADLARLSVICGYAEGSFTEEKLQVSTLSTASVIVFVGGNAFGSFESWDMAENYLENWDTLDSGSRTRVYKSLAEKLDKHLADTLKDLNTGILETPDAVRVLDHRYGSDLLDGMASALYRFAQSIMLADGSISDKEKAVLKDVWKKIYVAPVAPATPLADGPAAPASTPPPEPELKEEVHETLEDVLKELNELIGLDNIKTEVNTLINFLKIQGERTKRGMSETDISLHCVFYGPPGTGKTTVARLMSRVYKQMGFLEKGHLIETDRAGMVGSYIGHTSQKVDEKVQEALDGVLFIDEAYALKPEGSKQDFGQEAIDVLLKRMEDHRKRLIVVAAGYTDEMQRFIESNPGLKSRFNRFFYFKDYAPSELTRIFKKFVEKGNYTLSKAAEEKLLELFKISYRRRDRTFGNGRLARNLFEKVIENQANRLAGEKKLTDESIALLTPDDIPEADASWLEKFMAGFMKD